MEKLKVMFENGTEIQVEKGTKFRHIVNEYNEKNNAPVVLGCFNGKIVELNEEIKNDGEFTPIDITSEIGMKTYERTLQFIFIKAALDLFKDSKVTIEHTISKGLFGELHKEKPLTKEDITKIKNKMKEIINADIPINKIVVKKEEAINIFKSYGMEDKVSLLKYVQNDCLKLYELQGKYDYFYGMMAPSTGNLNIFDLMYYKPGFIIKYPENEKPFKLKKFKDQKKLSKIFIETENWGNILEVGEVGSLNDKVTGGESFDIIRVSEAFHEKKIANIADMVLKKKGAKVVLISGPSSSGKTTFARRLGIQLRVNGKIPVPISLDDYFVDREHTPKDENGDYDFESIYALDLELFNNNLKDLMSGKEVKLPIFDFKTGSRIFNDKCTKLPQNGILIIEGIHGLNELLTSSIAKENKFKIYISALTQLNLDNHNRIATTDVRKIRRIVRDFLSRGYSAEDTLKMWPSIRRGEEKNIFVFQEEADAMFNSALAYELCVLKKYAMLELVKIDEKSPVYEEAQKLMSFLEFFVDIDGKLVPDNSILREFIGGSCFYEY